jgi:hypothetical protein
MHQPLQRFITPVQHSTPPPTTSLTVTITATINDAITATTNKACVKETNNEDNNDDHDFSLGGKGNTTSDILHNISQRQANPTTRKMMVFPTNLTNKIDDKLAENNRMMTDFIANIDTHIDKRLDDVSNTIKADVLATTKSYISTTVDSKLNDLLENIDEHLDGVSNNIKTDILVIIDERLDDVSNTIKADIRTTTDTHISTKWTPE